VIVVIKYVAPRIIAPMEGQQFNIIGGNDLSITCTATGYPAPEVIWQTNNAHGSSIINSSVISTSPARSFPDVDNVHLVSVSRDLIITEPTKTVAGIYRCRAENTVGSTVLTITVLCKFVYIDLT